MGKKVLIVDDEPNICELVSIALTGKGLYVRVAYTGEAGIKAFKEFGPDLVLLDHRLPDMGGDDVARWMREAGAPVSIIRISGQETSNEALDGSLYAGQLKKPFKLADMVEYVEEFLKK